MMTMVDSARVTSRMPSLPGETAACSITEGADGREKIRVPTAVGTDVTLARHTEQAVMVAEVAKEEERVRGGMPDSGGNVSWISSFESIALDSFASFLRLTLH
jgi:hypothetical protein